MSEPLLAPVVAALDAMRAAHALVGAAAMAAHGVARSTFDADLLTTDVRVLDPARWMDLVRSAGCEVDVRRGDTDDPLAGVVRISRSGDRDVDVVVGREGWQADAIARAVSTEFGGFRVRVVGAVDLMLLKLFAGGTQDLWDIEQLLAAGDRGALVAGVDSKLALLPPDASDAWVRLTGRR